MRAGHVCFFFSSRRRHTSWPRDWSSDVCSSDLELDADFRPECFDHVARWNAEQEWIELMLRSRLEQRVSVPGADLVVEFGRGEELRTEISAKFRREGTRGELAAAGFGVREFWSDPRGVFALALAAAG